MSPRRRIWRASKARKREQEARRNQPQPQTSHKPYPSWGPRSRLFRKPRTATSWVGQGEIVWPAQISCPLVPNFARGTASDTANPETHLRAQKNWIEPRINPFDWPPGSQFWLSTAPKGLNDQEYCGDKRQVLVSCDRCPVCITLCPTYSKPT